MHKYYNVDNVNRHTVLSVCPILSKLHLFIAFAAISALLYTLIPPNVAWVPCKCIIAIPHVHVNKCKCTYCNVLKNGICDPLCSSILHFMVLCFTSCIQVSSATSCSISSSDSTVTPGAHRAHKPGEGPCNCIYNHCKQ